MTNEQADKGLALLVKAIVDTIREAGPIGAPGGVMYAAMMAHGCSLDQFERLMGAIVRTGLVVKRGDCYHIASRPHSFQQA